MPKTEQTRPQALGFRRERLDKERGYRIIEQCDPISGHWNRHAIPLEPTHVDRYQQALQKLLDRLRVAPLVPHEYEKIYRELALETLYRQAVELGGEPPILCLVDFELLQGKQKRYCSKRCQRIAKVRKARANHPEWKLRR